MSVEFCFFALSLLILPTYFSNQKRREGVILRKEREREAERRREEEKLQQRMSSASVPDFFVRPDKVPEVLRAMSSLEISPTSNLYASLVEAYGRFGDFPKAVWTLRLLDREGGIPVKVAVTFLSQFRHQLPLHAMVLHAQLQEAFRKEPDGM